MDVHDPQYPAFQQLTSNNHGPAVVVISFIFLVVAIASVLTRLITRFRAAKELVSDDWMILGSMLLSISQTIALTFAANAGLGRHHASLTESSFHSFEKAFYASEVLVIPTLALAKASAIFLIINLRPPRTLKVVCYGLLAIVGTWALAAVFALIFQCAPPDTWVFEGQCVDQRALNIANATWNILTDVALVIIPVLLMQNVHASAYRRLVVVCFFGCRIVVPPVAIVGLVILQPVYTEQSPDATWELVPGVMLNQGMICLSIITACVPTIKGFLANISSGMIAVNIPEPVELAMKSNSVSQAEKFSRNQSTFLGSHVVGRWTKSNSGTNKSTVDNHDMEPTFEAQNHHGLDSGSAVFHKSVVERSESVEGLRDDVIMQTIDYDVHSEAEQDGTSSAHDGSQGASVLSSRGIMEPQ